MSTMTQAMPRARGAIRRRVLAALLVVHGVAHLAGTTDLMARATQGRAADLAAGAATVSDPSVLRLLALVWAIVALAYVATATVVWAGGADWPHLVGAVTVASLAMVALGLTASAIGLAADLALLLVAARPALADPARRALRTAAARPRARYHRSR